MPLSMQNALEYDELTNLPTMMYFRRYASTFVRRAHSCGQQVYLVYFNLENFSGYNERYGFEEGDRLLRLTALAILESFPGFLLSRFSEDHFFLVCHSLDVEQGIREAHDVVRAVSRHANVELKAGVLCIEDDDFDIGVMCDRAKIACESIAHRYDQCFRWYDDALNWFVERSQYVESHIDQAIKNEWIQVYFQPIVRTTTGRVCEFEALARWEDPRYGMLSPGIFVDVLENAHLIHKLDGYVIRKACEIWITLSMGENSLVPVSVNLSRLDFQLCDVFQLVEGLVEEYRIPRQMLHLEITESALNEDSDELIESVALFRSKGYQVWLDDFGSGYSSLNTLKDYVFDVVKIDMAFLREFNTKPKSRIIIASIVNMAKQLGMQTLIEGVELPEQYEFLREIGCEFVQGYLIGRPATVEENLRRLRVGELVMEEPSLSGYYDRLGAINALSATPFDFPWETDPSVDRTLAEMAPLATIERDGDDIRIISSNQTFEETMRGFGLKGVSSITAYLNDVSHPQARTIRNTISTAVMSGRTESVDIMGQGVHALLHIRHIVSRSDVDALLISVINLSHFSNMSDEGRVRVATQYLYAVYDEVNIVDLASGVVSTIYRGNTVLPATLAEEKFVDATRRFTNVYVHPDDRARCIRYLDLTDIEERVEASGKSHLADTFRILNEQGTYSWMTSALVPIVVEGQAAVLVCVRKTNNEVLATLMAEDQIPKSLLWDTLVNLVPAGIFWKDANRRFVGVNRNFLDFYDFQSTNDVLGKTDEDMGWHVETDPFKNDELRVIQQGEPVINAHGTCISQGEVREITASKIPLRRNGEIIGLLGYFTDRALGDPKSSSLMFDGFDHLAVTDKLTGIPNLRGITSSAVSFVGSFDNGGPDFVYVVIDIRDMNDLNEVYGRTFGNRILKVVASKLTRACGVVGVVARIGGDKFAAMRQVKSVREGQTAAARLQFEVESIREVDGMEVHLRCYTGSALYSECRDVDRLMLLANERMEEIRDTL